MQLGDLALVLCVMAMWMMMMMVMSDLVDFLLDISRPLLVGRSVGRVMDGWYRGSTVSYRAKRVSCGCCCYSTFVALSMRQDFVSLSLCVSRERERQRKHLFLRDADTRGCRLIYHGWTDCLSCRFVDSIATSPGPISTTGSIRLLEEQVAAYLRDVEAA